MNHINSCTTIKKVRNLLRSFPADHEEAYQKTLNRILDQGPGRKELAAKTLTWICHVQRPVKMAEFQHALAIEKGAQGVDVEDLESPKTILSACLGLIVISRTDQTVNMVHSTAKTFVRSNCEKLDPEPELTITQACLTYMVFPELANGPCKSIEEFRTRLSRLPFLEYSARFYGSHAREVEKPSFSQLEAFLKDDNFRESSWQVVQFVFDMDHRLAQTALSMIPNQASAIHVAAYWGFPNLLAAFIAKEPAVKDPQDLLVNKPDSHGWTPLHWAASNGHAGLVQILLDSRAVIDAEDMSGWTPLFWAVVRGHPEVVSTLLSRGANCFHVDGEGMTALHWAISTAQDAIMQQLLTYGERKSVLTPAMRIAHLKKPKQFTVSEAKSVVEFKSLLDVAAEASNLDTIGALLESRARTLESAGKDKYGYPRTDNNGFMTADPLVRTLWRAWGKGEMFWPSEQRRSPLYAFRKRLLEQAITRGLLPIVNLLLELAGEHDLNRDILSEEGKHYMHIAACCRDPAILMALIDKGIDVNAKTSYGLTPLRYACIEGSCETIKALLACERLEFAGGESFEESPLRYFLAHQDSGILRTATDPQGALEVCQAFFSKGLSPKSRDKEGNTLLHLAVATWNPAIIKLLLNSGVDMNARNKYNETPLHYLASSGPPKLESRQAKSSGEASVVPKPFIDETIQMVLDLSEPENLALAAASYSGYHEENTPLARAINSKSWILADSLHERKARFHTTTEIDLADLIKDFKTASSPEKNSNNEAEAPREVDPESDGSPETFFSILKAVIKAGADVRKMDYWKVDPLQHAIEARGPPEIVRILLDAGADLSHRNSEGRNALQIAVAEGATAATISTLLQAGADPYLQIDNGLDCFQLALINGFEENLSLLLEHVHTHPDCPDSHWLHSRSDEVEGEDTTTFFLRALQNASAINTPDQHGHTLLFHAAGEGNTKLAQELLKYEVDINASDQWNWAPVHAAVWSRKAEMVELLLKSGAKIDQGLKSTSPYVGNGHMLAGSINTLHVAILDTNGVVPAIVRLLLEYGANPNEDFVDDEHRGNTRTSTLKLLFPPVGTPDSMTQDILISQEALEAAQYLVDGGADVSGVVDDMEVKHVAAFDGCESLWDSLREGITTRKESD
jgi:ankyrin repeat protein